MIWFASLREFVMDVLSHCEIVEVVEVFACLDGPW
jgi:hypothetical protein